MSSLLQHLNELAQTTGVPTESDAYTAVYDFFLHSDALVGDAMAPSEIELKCQRMADAGEGAEDFFVDFLNFMAREPSGRWHWILEDIIDRALPIVFRVAKTGHEKFEKLLNLVARTHTALGDNSLDTVAVAIRTLVEQGLILDTDVYQVWLNLCQAHPACAYCYNLMPKERTRLNQHVRDLFTDGKYGELRMLLHAVIERSDGRTVAHCEDSLRAIAQATSGSDEQRDCAYIASRILRTRLESPTV